MKKLLVIISFSVCTALAADTVTVQPEVQYPIINRNSLHNWQSVRSECLPATERDPVERCTVTKLGDLGKIDDKNFYFVLYEWLDKKEADDYDKSRVKYPRANT